MWDDDGDFVSVVSQIPFVGIELRRKLGRGVKNQGTALLIAVYEA